MWSIFGCKIFGDYHDIYLKTDILLFADVFEKFRDNSLNHYGLDHPHYFSFPVLSWDALLKKNKTELELLIDINIHLFIESGIRVEIYMVSKRFAIITVS